MYLGRVRILLVLLLQSKIVSTRWINIEKNNKDEIPVNYNPRAQQTKDNTNSQDNIPKTDDKPKDKHDNPRNDIYLWIVSIVTIIIGIPLCFFGYKYWTFVSWFYGFFAGLELSDLIYKIANENNNTEQGLDIAFVFINIAVGVVGAFLFKYCKRFNGAIMGIALGVAACDFIYEVIYDINKSSYRFYWNLLILQTCILIGFAYGCWRDYHMIIAGTAYTGSWEFWSGVGFISDTFPTYYPNLTGKIAPWWIFLACFVGMCIAGVLVQNCYKKKDDLLQNKNNDIYNADTSLD